MLLDFFLLIRVININSITNKVINKNISQKSTDYSFNNSNQIYASLPQRVDSFTDRIVSSDARPEIARIYLAKYNSPFALYAEDLVGIADKYSTEKVADLWKYIIAIAQCESNLGTKIPANSYNAWGLGIVTGASSGLSFNNWLEGIEYEAIFLKKLIDKNLFTPEEWGPIYAPPSALNGGSWAKCVHHFLEEI